MWYEVLKVSENASAEEIQISYNKLMGTPIVFNDADKEKEVKKAYLEGMIKFNNSTCKIRVMERILRTNLWPKNNLHNEKSPVPKAGVVVLCVIVLLFFAFTSIGFLILTAEYEDDYDFGFGNYNYYTDIAKCFNRETSSYNEEDLSNVIEELESADYTLYYESEEVKTFHKPYGDDMFIFDIVTIRDGYYCEIAINSSTATTWQDSNAILNKKVELSSIDDLSYHVKYSLSKEDPTYEYLELYSTYYNFSDPSEEVDTACCGTEKVKLSEYVSDEDVTKYIGIIAKETDSLIN